MKTKMISLAISAIPSLLVAAMILFFLFALADRLRPPSPLLGFTVPQRDGVCRSCSGQLLGMGQSTSAGPASRVLPGPCQNTVS